MQGHTGLRVRDARSGREADGYGAPGKDGGSKLGSGRGGRVGMEGEGMEAGFFSAVASLISEGILELEFGWKWSRLFMFDGGVYRSIVWVP